MNHPAVWVTAAIAAFNALGILWDVAHTADLADTGTKVEAIALDGSAMGPPEVMIKVAGMQRCSGGPATEATYDPADPSRCRATTAIGTLTAAEGRSLAVWLVLPAVVGGLAHVTRGRRDA